MTTSSAPWETGALAIGAEVTVYLRDQAMAVGTVTRVQDGDLYLTGTLQIDGAAGRADASLWLPHAAIVAVVISP